MGENRNKTECMTVVEIFKKLGRPTEETWPGLGRLPLLRKYEREDPTLASIKEQPEQGHEKKAIWRYFSDGEGKCIKQKYFLTEGCSDLLGGLLTLCPERRLS